MAKKSSTNSDQLAKWGEAWRFADQSRVEVVVSEDVEKAPAISADAPPQPQGKKTVLDRLASMPDRKKQIVMAYLHELNRRRIEATTLYEPMAHQLPFHQSKARVRLMGGGNRGGKTLCGMMEIGWIVRGNHPHYEYPKGGVIYIVGRDEKHLSDVIRKTLLEPGGGNGKWRRIRDLKTGKWRSFRPWEDDWRKDEAELMPPIIPPYLIKGKIAYTDKARGIISQFNTTTGWEIKLFTGGSDPPQGSSPDYVHLDEEITNRRWLTEMITRVTDKRGRVTWSATAEIGGESLWNLHMMCEEERSKPPESRLFEEFTATATVNDHLGQEVKDEMQRMLALDPLQYQTKFLGLYAVESYRVYPQFGKDTHTVEPFEVPKHWCRYMVVDPGHVVLAVEFFAVPPPDEKGFAGHVYGYGELYIEDANSTKFGKAVKEAVDSQVFEDFIVDYCGSRRTEMGGDTIREQLEAALEQNRVRCLRRGSRFLNSSSDLESGILRTKGWLLPIGDGKPKLLLMKGMCPKLELEMQRYHYGRDTKTGLSTGKPHQHGIHCCDVLRYGVMHGLGYVKPRNPAKQKSPARAFVDERNKRKNKDKKLWMTGGPS